MTPSTDKSRCDLNRVHALTDPGYVVGAAPGDPSIVPRKCSHRGRKCSHRIFRPFT
jgi:hypothetical protein